MLNFISNIQSISNQMFCLYAWEGVRSAVGIKCQLPTAITKFIINVIPVQSKRKCFTKREQNHTIHFMSTHICSRCNLYTDKTIRNNPT